MHARDAMKERSDSSRGVDGRSGPCWFISGLGGDGEIEPLEVVRAENRIHGSDQHSCSPGTLPVMLTGHVPAVPFPPDHAGHRVAAAVPACGCVEDRRDSDPAPPAPGPAALAELELDRLLAKQVKDRFKERGEKITVEGKNIGYELRCAPPIPFDIEYTRR